MIKSIFTFSYNIGKPADVVIVDVRNLKGPDKSLRDKYTGN
jgi:hypothetical protein